MMAINFNKMRKILTCCFFLGAVSIHFSCEKYDEVPPKSDIIIRDYKMPAPGFLTSEERALINKNREDYNNL